MDVPETNHTTSEDDVSLAYAFGSGTVDLVFDPALYGNVEVCWSSSRRRSLAQAVVVALGDPHESELGSIDVDGSYLLQVTHRLANYNGLAWIP